MPLDSAEIEPEQISCLADQLTAPSPALSLTGTEALLLDPDAPFARHYRYRAFTEGDESGVTARLVASIDKRSAGAGIGAIGFIAYAEALAFASGIRRAMRWLADSGASVIRCPVQFATPFGHRAAVSGLDDPCSPGAFLFEPTNRLDLAEVLQSAGFRPVHLAVSHLVDHQRVIDGTERSLRLMDAAGFGERPLNLAALDSDLATLHSLASAVFRDSWGYSDVGLDEFLVFYRPLAHTLDADLVRFLLDPKGEPVGFVFGYPDLLTPRFVLKTIAVLPEVRRAWPGVGSALIAIVHRLARAKGLSVGIHAFMAEGSYAQRRSVRWGSRMRSYATFERSVEGRP